MKNADTMQEKTYGLKEFCGEYFGHIAGMLGGLDRDAIASFVEDLEEARRAENTIFFIGNGGSSATASHMANDLGLGSRVEAGERPFRALSLADNVSAMTASANDCGYDTIFVRQLKLHHRPGDRLVAISASGNSPNIIAACEWVKKNGGRVIGMGGFDGGKLKDLSDIFIHVKARKGEYGPVEDIHMILGHLISTWIWHRERKEDAG